ncbi:MAG: M48 family metallopeptidase [Bacteroidota bacterium]
MKRIKLMLILLFPAFLFAQHQENFGRSHSDELPAEFRIDPAGVCQHIYQGISADYLTNRHRHHSAYRFADRSAAYVSRLLASGTVYSDWPEFEDYLNAIMDKVMPPELAGDKGIHAYIIKNGRYNAFMTPSGRTFFNVGLFGEVFDEATIAGVLAHELAHYYMQHSFRNFVKQERGDFRPSLFFNNEKSALRFSVANELQADSLAAVWLQRSGYHIDGLFESYRLMKQMEENDLLKKEDVWEIEETTHPVSGRRVESLKQLLKKEKGRSGRYFLVDSTKFHQFQRQAKAETLRLLLENFDYFDCIENAFKYHIHEPNNSAYVYYLMEAIRRKCYLDQTIWKEKFITHRYYKVIEEKGEKRKEKLEAHLFEKMPETILRLNPNQLDRIQGRFYWEDIKFITYEEAFEFFFKVGQLLEEPECILSNALSITFDKKWRNQLLAQYLAHENIAYREYAEKIMKDEAKSSLKNHKMTVLTHFYPVVKQGNVPILIRKGMEGKESQLSAFFDKVMEEKQGQSHFVLNDFKQKRLNDFRTLLQLRSFANEYTYAKGEKTEIHLLDPRYWQLMYKLGFNEIDFISAVYIETRKKAKTKEAYAAVTDLDLDQLLQKEKGTRFCNVYISSLRAMEGRVMKVWYHNFKEIILSQKGSVYDELVAVIQKEMEKKEAKAQKKDQHYQESLEKAEKKRKKK